MNVVGWSGPYPILSRKRPTADLVSRKVLVPLIGQIMISVLMQLTTYKAVKSQPWSVSLIYATWRQFLTSQTGISHRNKADMMTISRIPKIQRYFSSLLTSTYFRVSSLALGCHFECLFLEIVSVSLLKVLPKANEWSPFHRHRYYRFGIGILSGYSPSQVNKTYHANYTDGR